jgi:hypothetical protein
VEAFFWGGIWALVAIPGAVAFWRNDLRLVAVLFALSPLVVGPLMWGISTT